MIEPAVTKTELRKFACIWSIIFLAIGLYPLLQSHPVRIWALAVSFCCIGTGLLYPRVLNPFYSVWMKLGHVLGIINSRVIITVMFVFMITPIGLITRLFRRDLLRKRFPGRADSYWKDREIQPTSMKNQF